MLMSSCFYPGPPSTKLMNHSGCEIFVSNDYVGGLLKILFKDIIFREVIQYWFRNTYPFAEAKNDVKIGWMLWDIGWILQE